MPIGKEYIPFGTYVLIERLAAGGMGEVFLARVRDDSGRTVVIKRMRQAASTDPAARARFIDESRIATLMDHPNIVRVLDVGVHDGSAYMAMEWLLGWELREIIDAAARVGVLLPLPVVAMIMCEAARGLAAAHGFQTPAGAAAKLVHRDISPRNLFVTADGITKVLDFGLATSALHRRRTETRIVLGTHGYIAPEQLKGERVDQRSDIFSLGAVFHELITGEPLIARATPMASMLETMMNAPLPPPLRPSEEVDGALVSMVMRMLQRNREARYPSADHVVADLEAWLGRNDAPTRIAIADTIRGLFRGTDVGAPTQPHVALSHWEDGARDVPEPPLPATSSQRRVPRLALLVSLVLAIAVIGWGVSGMLRRPSKPAPAWVAVAPSPPAPAPPAPAPEVAPEPEPAAAPEPEPTRAPSEKSHAPRRSEHTKIAARKPPEPAPVPEAAPPLAPAKEDKKATGRLTLDARPWANVYVGATFLGPTPLVEISLPAGPTRLRLVDPVTGKEQSVMVEVPEGGDVRRVVKRD